MMPYDVSVTNGVLNVQIDMSAENENPLPVRFGLELPEEYRELHADAFFVEVLAGIYFHILDLMGLFILAKSHHITMQKILNIQNRCFKEIHEMVTHSYNQTIKKYEV